MLLMFLRVSHNSWLITNCVYVADGELVSDTSVVVVLIIVLMIHSLELVPGWKCTMF